MTHPRHLIRDAIAARIETVPVLAGRVFTTRTKPTAVEELPVALVYSLNETAELLTIGGALRRTLSAVVEVRTKAADDLDDALDALCEAVEDVLNVDRNLAGIAFLQNLASTNVTLDGEGETRQLLATLTYTITYDTAA